MATPLSQAPWSPATPTTDKKQQMNTPRLHRHRTLRYSEAEMDSYSQRVLESRARETPDQSLGPYVTSVLRSALNEAYFERVQDVPDYDSLLELVQEHCACSESDALESLQAIAQAVRTKEIPNEEDENDIDIDNNFLLATTSAFLLLEENQQRSSTARILPPPPGLTTPQASLDCTPSKTSIPPSPLNANSLISVDLMGALDNPPTPLHPRAISQPPLNIPTMASYEPPPPLAAVDEAAFPPLGATAAATTTKKKPARARSGSVNTYHAKPQPADDLAASLFVGRRSRQSSIDETANSNSSKGASSQSPILTASAAPPGFSPVLHVPETVFDEDQEFLYASTVEMLLSMNADVSEQAAYEATQMAMGDVNVAQYLIDCVLSASPICRHLLHNGCYRSDCTFSHDIDNHTCLFWLRGRCNKEASCRFLHGFAPLLLNGIMAYSSPQNQAGEMHNLHSQLPPPLYQSSGISMQSSADSSCSSLQQDFPSPNQQQQSALFPDLQAVNMFPSPLATSVTTSKKPLRATSGGSAWGSSGAKSLTSFANVASQRSAGGTTSLVTVNKKPNFADHPGNNANMTRASLSPWHQYKPKKVDIPWDVWSAHENRDASAFYIADPMERYRAVAATRQPRPDVIDLHFQSTKTFPEVLRQVLPAQLERSSAVWIVTGTGHHVGSRTHQKGGGALELAVIRWLTEQGYGYAKGRDRNGQSGALLVYGDDNEGTNT